jgi:PPE-SVP subfamily C-terminal region/Short C-terminal domain
VSTGQQLLSTVPAALQGLAQPLQSTSGLTGILDSLGFNSVQSFFTLGNAAVPYTVSMNTVNLGIGATHFAQSAGVAAAAETGGAGSAPVGEVGSGGGALLSAGPAGLSGSSMTARLGQGTVVGGLSVPPGWATAAPEIRTIARSLPISRASADPAVFTGSSETQFSEMALASMAGSAMSGSIGLRCRERVGAITPQRVGLPVGPLGGPITGIAAELQKLAELHNSGVLTDEEFSELKGRLLGR